MIFIPSSIVFLPLTANAQRKDQVDFLNELELMKRMKPHKNVLQLLGCCVEKGTQIVDCVIALFRSCNTENNMGRKTGYC